jgi:DNA-binding PadR family transcriptional regulator
MPHDNPQGHKFPARPDQADITLETRSRARLARIDAMLKTIASITADDYPAELAREARQLIIAEQYAQAARATDTPDLRTDGGHETTWTDLTGFQRDLLKAIARLDSDTDHPPSGQAIKDDHERATNTTITHGRLYPNLDTLVEAGFIEKGRHDRRTNTYEPTPLALRTLERQTWTLADAATLVADLQAATDGGKSR